MPPINSDYSRYIAKSNTDYTITVSDDVITFTIASPQTATLPLAGLCGPQTGQSQKQIVNSSR